MQARLLLLIGLLPLAACGDRSSERHTGARSTTVAAETVPLARRARTETPIEKLTAKIDPANDIWDTEVLSEVAGSQLEVLRLVIEGRQSIDEGRVADLVAEGFATGSLRPTELDLVFADDVLTVRRWEAGSGSAASTPSHSGAAGLVEALTPLRQALAGGQDVRAALKLYQIGKSESFFATRILVEASSRSEGGGTQISASWSCRWEYPANGQVRLLEIELERYEEVSIRRRTLFADVTQSALGHNSAYRQQVLPGINHWLSRISRLAGISLFGHHGVAVGDVNGDGLPDLYVSETGGLPNRLYVQNPDGTATDVSAAAGVDWLESTSSALLIDLDNDGDQDLIAAALRMLFVAENDGQGRFVLHRPLRDVVAGATSMAAADYDGDGDLDIYVCGYKGDPENSGLPAPIPYHDANNGGANALLENRGGFELVDVTAETGLDMNNSRFSFAAAWEDYDNDGDVDLYVANDFGRNNLYRNDGGQFVDVAPAAGVEDVAAGMSVSWGDPNRDGLMDVYVGNMFSSAGNRVAYQRGFAHATGAAASDLQRMARGNTLFVNAGTRGFVDVSEAAGVTMGRWSWGSRFADLNNDGWQDLVVTNGFVSNEDTGDL